MSPYVVIYAHATIGPLGVTGPLLTKLAKAYVRDAMPSIRTNLRPGTSCAIPSTGSGALALGSGVPADGRPPALRADRCLRPPDRGAPDPTIS